MTRRDLVKLISNAFANTPMLAEDKIMCWGSGARQPIPPGLWELVVNARNNTGRKSRKQLAALRQWKEFVDETIPGGDFAYVWQDLAGKRWQDLTPDEIRSGHAALSMMTPQGICYYLPAYLRLIISNPDRADLELDKTIHVLSPPPFGFSTLEEFESNVNLLSIQQRIAVSYFFEYVRRSVELFGGGGSPLDRLTCYWLKYYVFPLPEELAKGLESAKPFHAVSRYENKQSLIKTIREAFSRDGVPEVLFINEVRTDSQNYGQILSGKGWRELNSADISQLASILTKLTPAAFQYYIPAFLITLLTQPHGLEDALKSTVWALSPLPTGQSTSEDFEERISLLNLSQVSAIDDFFLYLRTTEYYICQFLGEGDQDNLNQDYWDMAAALKHKEYPRTNGISCDPNSPESAED